MAENVSGAKRSAIVLLSGGLDSTTLLYRLTRRDDLWVHAVAFDYGQKHKRQELKAARVIADIAGVGFTEIVLGESTQWSKAEDPKMQGYQLVEPFGNTLTNVASAYGRPETASSLLAGGVEVPEGHYTEESMRSTVVPNRNAIMLSIAWGIAVAQGANLVATAVHAGDHAIYPDCRPEFIYSLSQALRAGTEGFRKDGLIILAPYLNWTKADIVTEGSLFGVPYKYTYSCYVGGERHCGRCGTCVERAAAFVEAGVKDPTEYEDPNFFKGVTNVRPN